MVPVVTVSGLRTRLGGTEVLRGIDFAVGRGEVVALIGPSGGGKTTLLRGLNYLTPFCEGSVSIAGQQLLPNMSERAHAAALRAVRLRVGMVFQAFHLFPHLTALENVMEAPLRVLRLDRTLARQRAQQLLDRVGMTERAHAFPHLLSGGQQQRVAIARALAMDPEVLLLDEPTSALDQQLVGDVLAVVSDIASKGQTVLMATHELAFARRVAQRVLVLADGQIVESGAAAEILDRRSALLAPALQK